MIHDHDRDQSAYLTTEQAYEESCPVTIKKQSDVTVLKTEEAGIISCTDFNM